MRRIALLSCLLLALSACVPTRNETATPLTPTTTPSPTGTPTPAPLFTPSPTLVPSPTFTPLPPYPDKKVILNYYVLGNHSAYDTFFELDSSQRYSRLVLYADGQMLLLRSADAYNLLYDQKMLSPQEVKSFLSKLDALGFYSLESNYKHDPTDKLYDYGNNYQQSFDGLEHCVYVNANQEKELCAYEPDMQFVVPKMKRILQYLDQYRPAGMAPYYPDRLLLWVQIGRDVYRTDSAAAAIPWDTSLPPLAAAYHEILYVDGTRVKDVYLQFQPPDRCAVFTQNGQDYTVCFAVVLPHEKLTNADQ